MRTGRSSCVLRTQACSHSTSVGQTRAHMPPMMFSLRMVWAEPLRLPLRIFWMKPGMSMPVGQAVVQGAS